MLRINYITLFLLFFLSSFRFSAQNERITIKALLAKVDSQKDTARLNSLKKISELLIPINIDSALIYAELLHEEANQYNDELYVSDGLHLLGYCKREQELFEESIDLFTKALKIRKRLKAYDKASNTLNLIGTVYHKSGDWELSLEYYLKAIEEGEINNNPRYLSSPISNIGKLYSDMGENEKAKEYDVEALRLAIMEGDKREMATSYNNLGTIYQETGFLDTAKIFYKEALKLYTEIGQLGGAAHVYNNMGIICFMEGDYKMSLQYFKDALRMRLKDRDMVNYSQSLMNLGIYYQMLGDYDSAIYYADTSGKVAVEYNALMEQKDAYIVMAESYDSLGRYEKALRYYQKFVLIKDSIMDEKSLMNMQELETKYQTDQQKKELELKDLRIQQEEEEKAFAKSQKKFQFTLIGIGGVAMLLILLLMARGYLLKRKSNIRLAEFNAELETQKEIIEEKNKDITDSILYAQRIQEAMLHSGSQLGSVFPDSFIIYKPKDIVAGDFYWWIQQGNRCYLAAADCTGHGVPGAMVSVVCSSVLNKSVKELNLTQPAAILEKATELVIDSFSVNDNEEDIKDGMDIALCSMTPIDATSEHPGAYALQFAGANNPLWIVRKNGDFEELSPNRQPIGYYQHSTAFVNSEVTLFKGDTIYLFSDGYVDQFGGAKNKKYKSSNFKQKLLEIKDKSMAEQQTILEEEFENWKGGFEQTDDVCLIGVRI